MRRFALREGRVRPRFHRGNGQHRHRHEVRMGQVLHFCNL